MFTLGGVSALKVMYKAQGLNVVVIDVSRLDMLDRLYNTVEANTVDADVVIFMECNHITPSCMSDLHLMVPLKALMITFS